MHNDKRIIVPYRRGMYHLFVKNITFHTFNKEPAVGGNLKQFDTLYLPSRV